MVSSGGRRTTGRVAPPGRHGGSRGRWDLGAGDAESVLAEARRAFFVMAGFLAVIWVLQIANWADHYRIALDYGIRPRDIGSLPNVVGAPFLHFSWAHIEGNSGPLFIFGFLAAYRGVRKFIWVTILIMLTSGLAAWLAAPSNTVGAGASGLVFGYFGYIMVRGFFDRHLIDIVIGVIMALCFAYQFSVLLPRAGIGWQAHIGGLVGGVAAGWIFRERRPKAPAKPAAATGATAGLSFPGTQTGTLRKPSGPGDRAP
jgi:membrane associated rhomboid family serine protease